jgi:hypothetical protein
MVLTRLNDSRSKGTGKALAHKKKKSFLPFLMDVIEETGSGRKRIELSRLQHGLLTRGWHP